MPKFGPLTIDGDFEGPDENISVFGPINVSGNLTVRSIKSMGPTIVGGSIAADFIRTNGPLQIGDKLVANRLKVNGPLTVNGACKLNSAHVNGPARITEGMSVVEHLQLNGPIAAESITARSITLNGPVDIENSIAALEQITITSGFGSVKQLIKAKSIKAPEVTIRKQTLSIPIIFRFLFGRRRNKEIPEVNVPIIADRVILDGVKFTGRIQSDNILLENGAEYQKLLEE
jgi:cytoskeletal protein CcmA (bactofilin family)